VLVAQDISIFPAHKELPASAIPQQSSTHDMAPLNEYCFILGDATSGGVKMFEHSRKRIHAHAASVASARTFQQLYGVPPTSTATPSLNSSKPVDLQSCNDLPVAAQLESVSASVFLTLRPPRSDGSAQIESTSRLPETKGARHLSRRHAPPASHRKRRPSDSMTNVPKMIAPGCPDPFLEVAAEVSVSDRNLLHYCESPHKQ
jgi:hypothetical protein